MKTPRSKVTRMIKMLNKCPHEFLVERSAYSRGIEGFGREMRAKLGPGKL